MSDERGPRTLSRRVKREPIARLARLVNDYPCVLPVASRLVVGDLGTTTLIKGFGARKCFIQKNRMKEADNA
jgi:hypothetical protein